MIKFLFAYILSAFFVPNVMSQVPPTGNVEIVGFTNEIVPMPASLVGAYLVDSYGRRTGDDPTRPPVIDPQVLDRICCNLKEIPQTNMSRDRLDPDDDSGGYGNEDTNISAKLPSGTYTLIMFSTVTYPVHYFMGALFNNTNQGATHISSDGILPSGTTVAMTVNYAPGKPPSVTKIVTFPVLRADLAAAYQVGDVGDKGFVAELDANLAAGENALAHGGRDAHAEAIAALIAFIGGINSALHVDCHEKRPYKNEDRFFTQDMAESFIDDAWTLIVQLGGDDHRPKRGKVRSRN